MSRIRKNDTQRVSHAFAGMYHVRLGKKGMMHLLALDSQRVECFGSVREACGTS